MNSVCTTRLILTPSADLVHFESNRYRREIIGIIISIRSPEVLPTSVMAFMHLTD